jgi:hypothetical protein
MGKNDKIVYILGAGCSSGQQPDGPGFPFARDFASALEAFSKEQLVSDNCQKLRTLVTETVDLLRREKVQTLDALAARLGSESQGSQSYSLTQTQKQMLRRQVGNARIATAALFMYLEKNAKQVGLPRYDYFLTELFGNSTDWAKASRNSNANILTFNYDRLFEMAFIDRFKCDTGLHPLYGKSLLNSGLDYVQGNSFGVSPDQFAFLKLHGSVGVRAREEGDHNPQIYTYYDGLPGDEQTLIDDERFFAYSQNVNPYEHDPEPLIVFPHEKPFVTAGTKTLLSFRSYIPNVWAEAKRLISEATEIWAIGYSFAPMDRADVLDLFRSTTKCKKLIVQNTPGTAEMICARLQKKWFEPENIVLSVVPYPHPF